MVTGEVPASTILIYGKSMAGRDMPLTSFQDAFASHRVIAAADKSAAEGRPVKLSEINVEW